MKFIATFFEASSLSGFKSCANILPDISIEMTISIPSVVISSQDKVDCGRANAIIRMAKAMVLNRNKR